MKKTLLTLIATAMMLSAVAGFALSKGSTLYGKVSAVDGNKVTIEVEDASGVKVGTAVEVELKEKKAPKAGKDMLMGC